MTKFVNLKDEMEYVAYRLTRKKQLEATEVGKEIKAIDKELEELKPGLQGYAALHGDIASPHLSVTFRAGQVRVDVKMVEYVVRRLAVMPEMGELARILGDAISRGDDSGTVTLKVPLSEIEMKRWDNELKEMMG